MTCPGTSDMIKALLERNKEALGESIRIASNAHDGLYNLLGIDNFNRETEPHLVSGLPPELKQKATDLQYALEMFRVYITAGPNQRLNHMKSFADDYQRPFSEVKTVLDYLGLPI